MGFGKDAGVEFGLSADIPQEIGLGFFPGEGYAVGQAVNAGFVGADDVVTVDTGVGNDVDKGILLPVAFHGVVAQVCEHGTVGHVMTVNDGVVIHQVGTAQMFQKNGSHGIFVTLPGVVQVEIVVLALHQGVMDVGVGNGDPANHIGIHFPQGSQVDPGQVIHHRILLDGRGDPLDVGLPGGRNRHFGNDCRAVLLDGDGNGILVGAAALVLIHPFSCQQEGADQKYRCQQQIQTCFPFCFHSNSPPCVVF